MSIGELPMLDLNFLLIQIPFYIKVHSTTVKLKFIFESILNPHVIPPSYYHLIAWLLPCFQTITILILNGIDGDPISGICYIG
ncbi:unnamed protein product, partial [Rotaria sp. Silwood1]